MDTSFPYFVENLRINIILGLNWNNFILQRLCLPRITLKIWCVNVIVMGGGDEYGKEEYQSNSTPNSFFNENVVEIC